MEVKRSPREANKKNTLDLSILKNKLQIISPVGQSTTHNIIFYNNMEKDVIMRVSWQHNDTANCITGPKDFAIKKNSKGTYPVTFSPIWVLTTSAILIIYNPSTNESNEYEITGIAEEPPLQGTIKLECNLNKTKAFKMNVKNSNHERIAFFKIQTDLKHAIGPDMMKVKAGGAAYYEMEVTPKVGETYFGYVRFFDNFQELWYKVEVITNKPLPEKVIPLFTYCRKPLSFNIVLNSQLNYDAIYDVVYKGEGLYGADSFVLPAQSKGVYKLVFAPLTPTDEVGSINFVNDELGEIWYELRLKAENPPPTKLENMKAEIGSLAIKYMDITNPLDREIDLVGTMTNEKNFDIDPPYFTLEPFSTAKIKLTYTPTKLVMTESTKITYESKEAGSWTFLAFGQALPLAKVETGNFIVNNSSIDNSGLRGRKSTAEGLRSDHYAKDEIYLNSHARSQAESRIPISGNPYNDVLIKARFVDRENGRFLTGPTELVVKAQTQAEYIVTFSPEWIVTSLAKLQLLNTTTNELTEYEIRGFGEEPLPAEHIDLLCEPNSKKTFTIPIQNYYNDRDMIFAVETDLKNIRHPKTVKAGRLDNDKFEIEVTATESGVSAGYIKLVDENERYVIYTVEIRTSCPMLKYTNAESPKVLAPKISLRTRVRKAVSYSLPIENKTDQLIKFKVKVQGPDLYGDNHFFVQPGEISNYPLFFSPLKAMKEVGTIIFKNEFVGDLKWDFILQGDEVLPTELPLIKAEFKSIGVYQLLLENPSCEEARVTFELSNNKLFAIEPKDVILNNFLDKPMASFANKEFTIQPYETRRVNLVYKPSTVGVKEVKIFS